MPQKGVHETTNQISVCFKGQGLLVHTIHRKFGLYVHVIYCRIFDCALNIQMAANGKQEGLYIFFVSGKVFLPILSYVNFGTRCLLKYYISLFQERTFLIAM